jgi:glycosyltransferase involved in cell wall biosynthesis
MGKRLLLISSNSSGRGGGERYLVYLSKGLHLIGCEVHILLSKAEYMNDWAQLFTAESAHVHRSSLLGLSARPLRFVQAILDRKQQKEVANVCRHIAPDAILVNQQYDEDGLDYLAGALASQVAPVGGIIHMPMTAGKHQRPLGKFRGKLLRQWYANHPYSLVLVSQGSQKEFENYYSHPRPTQVVHHGCEFADIASEHPILPAHWDKSLPVIGFSGQFVSQKNLKLLIDSWLWALNHGIESYLLLIGDGPERIQLEQYLHIHAHNDLWHITGWQQHPEIYLSALDIYVMTSDFEGLPLALIEAAGRGIPAVVTPFNGAADIAQHAPWVRLATGASPESVGTTLLQSIQQLPWLKQEASEGRQSFQKYFSLERMANDTLAALGIA